MSQRLERALRAERMRLDAARAAHGEAQARRDALAAQIALHARRIGAETACVVPVDPHAEVARAWVRMAKAQAVLLAGNLEESEAVVADTRSWLSAQLLQVRAIEQAMAAQRSAAAKAADRAAQIAQDDRNAALAARSR